MIAGRVRNVDDSRIPDLLHTNLSIPAYESLLLSMTDNKKARLRHHHSAVISIILFHGRTTSCFPPQSISRYLRTLSLAVGESTTT